MNISPLNGMASGSTQQILPSQPSKQNGEEGKNMSSPEKERAQILKIKDAEAEKEKAKEKVAKIDDLILKPSPTTLEERLNQVISEEEVKDILSLVTGVPLAKDEEHKVDVKR